ncbi:hypothetical protein NDI76_06995 [Halogeometricum sp. S1BR25-6]|uniref:Flagellin N-terminal-like domain-containing protein n=1 Tax=Halogeometricum salsisoli TaxID=2950536 RepID=A0ABU2GDX8_9EURY|nr:hypothetical protein [Halogeometricum sp. S1BR25-6]MDS0298483.1 hypothetical protein [Halogeometricum sp. S1BR25-6]
MTSILADDRGQTTIDFVVGISIFLLVVAFVVLFVPGIFDPFDGTSRTQAADRFAATLASDALGDPATPATLNATCTGAFFEQMQTNADATAACGFDATADTVAAALGTDRYDVNVTVFDGGSVAELDDPAGGPAVALSAGPPVPDNEAVATTRRVVLLDGRTHQLAVRVW